MELTAAISVIGAVLVPFIVAVITRPEWTAERKRGWTIGVCVVIGALVGIATGQVETHPTVQSVTTQLLVAVGVITSLSQGFYLALKQPVDALNAATSPDKS